MMMAINANEKVLNAGPQLTFNMFIVEVTIYYQPKKIGQYFDIMA